MPIVRIYGLKQERGEFFIKYFRKFEGIMKANEESQTRKLWKTMHKAVLVDFQKINRLFLRLNRLFLSTVNKNNLKQIYMRSGKERAIEPVVFINS